MSRSDVVAALWADMQILAVISLPPKIPWQYTFDMVGLYDVRTRQVRDVHGVLVGPTGLNRLVPAAHSAAQLRLLPRCDDQILPTQWPYDVQTEADLAVLHHLHSIPVSAGSIPVYAGSISKKLKLARRPKVTMHALAQDLQRVKDELRRVTAENSRLTRALAAAKGATPTSSGADDASPQDEQIAKLQVGVRVLFGCLDVPASTVYLDQDKLVQDTPVSAQQLACSAAVQAHRAGALTAVDVETFESFRQAMSQPRMFKIIWLAIHPDKVRLPFAPTVAKTGNMFDVLRPQVLDTLNRLRDAPPTSALWLTEWTFVREYIALLDWRAALLPRITL